MPNKDEIIIITAARPGLWFKEKFNIKRWLSEQFHDDYSQTMGQLRKIDDAIATWVKDIETILKNVRKRQKSPGRLSETRAIDLADMLGDLNRRFKQIEVARNILEENNEKYLDRFEQAQRGRKKTEPKDIRYNLSDEEMAKLQKLRASGNIDELIATAGWFDDLKDRWMSRKRETKQDKARRAAFESLIDKAEDMVGSLKGHLKDLENARAEGNVGDYIDLLTQVSAEQKDFETDYVDVHNTYIRPTFEETMMEGNYENEPPTLRMAPPEQQPLSNEPPAQEMIHNISLSDEDVEIIEDSPELSAIQPTTEIDERVGPPTPAVPYQIDQRQALVPAGKGIPPSAEEPEGPKTKQQPLGWGRVRPRKKEQGFWPDVEEREIAVQEEAAPKTQPSSGMSGIEFEGISPGDMDIPGETMTSGKGKARSGPIEVAVEAMPDKLFVKRLNKQSNEAEMVSMIIRYSTVCEDTNPDKSDKLLDIADEILSNVQ